MNCPKCDIELKKKSIQGIEVDECDRCEGIWFDKDELRQVKDHTDPDLNWMDFDIWKHPEKFKPHAHKYTCPNCGKQMETLNYDETHVEIDYCTACQGIWLDKNELQNLIDALEEEILNKSLHDYWQETVQEAKEILTGSESFFSEWKDFTTILRFLQYRILSAHPEIHNALITYYNNPLNK